MVRGKEPIIRTEPLEEFFIEQVRSAIHKEQVAASAHTEFYLVRMLLDFCHSASLSPSQQDADQPLAILYLQSFHAGRYERIKMLKHLADLVLFLSGYFQDSRHLRNMDLDYYIAMGGTAYHRLGSLAETGGTHDAFAETFVDLSKNFTRYMDVLTEVSEHQAKLKDSDLLRLYEKWLMTGSKRLQRKLREFGILTHLIGKRDTLQ